MKTPRPDRPSRQAPALITDQAAAIEPAEAQVYARIYEAVLDHRLSPGTKLKEVELAEMFGVTRGTIRKAFAQLSAMRVIELRPNRGAIVATPSVAESRDLFAARRTIESAIVDTLSKQITKAQLRQLNSLIRQEDLAYRRGDTRAALKFSVDFHRVLAVMAGNTVLVDVLEQLVSRTPLVVLSFKDPSQGNQSNACANTDHVALVEALAAHDTARAVEAMNCHLCNLEGQLNLRGDAPASGLAAIFRLDDGARLPRAA